MCRLLGLDKLSIELLKTFYYGKHLMYNFINIIDIDNFKKSNDAQNIINFEKLEFIHYLLNELGFTNIFDNKLLIKSEAFISKFKNIYNTHNIYKNKKEFKINFNIPFIKLDQNTTTRQILGHLNSILSNYSIKIKCIQKTMNNEKVNSYCIEILNDVDELLHYKVLKNYKLIDKNNIFRCSKINLRHLFIPEEIELDDDKNILSYSHENTDDIYKVDSNKNYWICRFCNIRDYEYSRNFFNDMQCSNCMETPMLQHLNTVFF
jgi:hypothetical protein